MSAAIQIPSGDYEIGDDSIPNAGPRHWRRIDRAYWIDAEPVTWAHFEVFVASGGYARRELWPQGAEAAETPQPTVDERCRTLLDNAAPFREALAAGQRLSRQQPITGVTWFEAYAICRFYSARLAFEAEWEIAMAGLPMRSERSGSRRSSRGGFDCIHLMGRLQEWAGDAFTTRYWRSDASRAGSLWRAEPGNPCVCVRGSGPEDLYQHISARTGAEPGQGNPCRGFRRVWDASPRDEDLHASWRA